MKQQRSFSGIFRRLVKDREGMGAVEFAIIVPILLMVYITSFELTIGLSVAKRATRASGSIADIVTQQTSVNKTYLKTMINAADGIFEPYGITGLKLKITGISIDASSKPTVAWSWAQDDSRPYAVAAAGQDGEYLAGRLLPSACWYDACLHKLLINPGISAATFRKILEAAPEDFFFQGNQ